MASPEQMTLQMIIDSLGQVRRDTNAVVLMLVVIWLTFLGFWVWLAGTLR